MGKFLLVLVAILAVAYLVPAPPVHRTASAEIHTSREKVWEALSDLSRIPSWDGGVPSIEFLTSQRHGTGARFRIPTTPVARTFEVVDWRPYNRIDYRVKTEPGLTYDHSVSLLIRALNERTVVQLNEDYRVRGGYLGHLLDLVYTGPSTERSRSGALANFKRWIETGTDILLQ